MALRRSALSPLNNGFDLDENIKPEIIRDADNKVRLVLYTRRICDGKLSKLVLDENAMRSFAGAFVEMNLYEADADWLVPRATETGDLRPLIAHIRRKLSPSVAQLVVDIIEKKWKRPSHRIRTRETLARHVRIATFLQEHLEKGVSLPDAKELATKKFKVSASTVRDVWQSYLKQAQYWSGRDK